MARAFLRHDPDIILIGEIRDHDTADVAVKAAQTGHLILSTVHTNDSIGTIPRLQSLGVNSNMISSSMLGALSQRLVRRICPHCREEYEPNQKFLDLFGEHMNKTTFTHGKGCRRCNQTGYHGRIGIFELFYVDDEIQDMIQLDASLGEILAKALIKGMMPLTVDGILKVEQDITKLARAIALGKRKK